MVRTPLNHASCESGAHIIFTKGLIAILRNSVRLTLFVICVDASCSAAEDLRLEFPVQRICGTVSIGPQPTLYRGWPNFNDQMQTVGEARGAVTVPGDAFVELEVTRQGAADLSFLSALPAAGIHSLKLNGACLGNADFDAIARFTALRSLSLNNCHTAPHLDMSHVPGAAALQFLNFSMSEDEGRKMVSAWAANCFRLQYLYDAGGPFDLSTLRRFKGHPALDFLTVEFGADATEIIHALSDIPRLRGLNVHATTEDYRESLPLLQGVELFNWSGGSIDAAALKLFGQIPSLRRLRFQGNAKIAADFSIGLPSLATVEELLLNSSESKCPAEELQIALRSMKSLTDWPKIRLVTKQTLESMAARENLRSIDLDELGHDATVEQVVRICRMKTLESIWLRRIPFTPEIGEALSNCPNLSALSLDVETFDGNHFKNPDTLTQLKAISLNVDGSAVNLSPLGRLPKLQQLSLSVESLQSIDYRFVAESRSLKSFFSRSNVMNDEAVSEIAKSRNLELLYLGENCILSDTGLKRLAQCRQLKRLSTGGVVTSEGVRQLDRIPSLLSVSVSSLLSESERQSLQQHFAYLSSARFEVLRSSYGTPIVGTDGLWRENNLEWRNQLDELEGKTLQTLLGPALSESLAKDLQGKVVLVDFWGTWCGPCHKLMPALMQFRDKFGEDKFEVLGIHSEQGLEDLDEYLRKSPKPWPNLRDVDGKLAKVFAVPHYPGVYLFDREGKMRIAIPYRPGLEAAIRHLVEKR